MQVQQDFDAMTKQNLLPNLSKSSNRASLTESMGSGATKNNTVIEKTMVPAETPKDEQQPDEKPTSPNQELIELKQHCEQLQTELEAEIAMRKVKR